VKGGKRKENEKWGFELIFKRFEDLFRPIIPRLMVMLIMISMEAEHK